MPYDPNKPANGAPILSAELRSQFAGLNDLIEQRVNFTDLNDAILANSAGSAANIQPLALAISNPPTQTEVQSLVEKFNELLDALKRV